MGPPRCRKLARTGSIQGCPVRPRRLPADSAGPPASVEDRLVCVGWLSFLAGPLPPAVRPVRGNNFLRALLCWSHFLGSLSNSGRDCLAYQSAVSLPFQSSPHPCWIASISAVWALILKMTSIGSVARLLRNTPAYGKDFPLKRSLRQWASYPAIMALQSTPTFTECLPRSWPSSVPLQRILLMSVMVQASPLTADCGRCCGTGPRITSIIPSAVNCTAAPAAMANRVPACMREPSVYIFAPLQNLIVPGATSKPLMDSVTLCRSPRITCGSAMACSQSSCLHSCHAARAPSGFATGQPRRACASPSGSSHLQHVEVIFHPCPLSQAGVGSVPHTMAARARLCLAATVLEDSMSSMKLTSSFPNFSSS